MKSDYILEFIKRDDKVYLSQDTIYELIDRCIKDLNDSSTEPREDFSEAIAGLKAAREIFNRNIDAIHIDKMLEGNI